MRPPGTLQHATSKVISRNGGQVVSTSGQPSVRGLWEHMLGACWQRVLQPSASAETAITGVKPLTSTYIVSYWLCKMCTFAKGGWPASSLSAAPSCMAVQTFVTCLNSNAYRSAHSIRTTCYTAILCCVFGLHAVPPSLLSAARNKRLTGLR